MEGSTRCGLLRCRTYKPCKVLVVATDEEACARLAFRQSYVSWRHIVVEDLTEVWACENFRANLSWGFYSPGPAPYIVPNLTFEGPMITSETGKKSL